jgi:RNA polymerase sigma factor (sigma-70 family)
MEKSMQTPAIPQTIRFLANTANKNLSDRQLLERFVAGGEESAFFTLVERHGPMVKRICLHLLRHEQDAEDAFQATFLVLAQKAKRVRWQISIRCWLVQVAWRTAASARTLRERRRLRERQASFGRANQTMADERLEIVRAELLRLPEKYRLPLWLCFWEGQTQDEAAHMLACSPGALRGRLFRGKNLLRRRLQVRGLTIVAGLAGLANTLVAPTAHAAVVSSKTKTTLAKAAVRLALGEPTNQVVSSTIAALMKGASMFTNRCKLAATIATLLVATVGLVRHCHGIARDDALAARGTEARSSQVQEVRAPHEEWLNLMNKIDVDRDRVGQGVWRMNRDRLIGYPAGHGGRLRIPVVPKGNYELRVRWEPKTDDAGAFFILPHGDKMASFDILSAYGNAGLGDLNGVRSDVNETNKKLRIKGGTTYAITVQIKYDDTQFHMLAKIDDQVIVDWEGKRAEVIHEFFAPPKPASLGLAVANQSSTFHSVELRMLTGKSVPWQPGNKND